MASVKTLLTFEEYEQLPDQPCKRELLKGELIEQPMADFRHNWTSHFLFLGLRSALEAAHARGEAAELGAVWHEMGFKMEGDILVIPDVSVTHAGQPVDKYLRGAPAIAIEVLSPSNTVKELKRKTDLYFQFGAREVWRLDLDRKGIAVRLPGRSHDLAEDDILSTPLLPGLAIPVPEVLGG